MGDLVELKQLAGTNAPRGPYEIVRLLPDDHGVPVYRIQRWHEEYERVAEETQLRRFS
jgi:hypothetical protein